ncbi:hypothetical protein ABIE44_003748 [Marmoricola sp. OAE513]|uniref:hypothetical protein n=1 Tax=Marmoricola sp. OAE513 TaxID=2817894 RepID=UPI001AE247A2
MKLRYLVGAGAVLSTVAVGISTPPAQAVDWCSGGLVFATPNYGVASCDPEAKGTYVRVSLQCYHVTPTGTRDHYARYGPWVLQKRGYSSRANCATGDRGEGWGIQVK